VEHLKKKRMTRKKWKSIKLFLYVAPFMALVLVFSYYPLYGWIYAFYDYRPPKPFSQAEFVGLKWFKSLVENDIKIKQIVQVLENTFAMSALTLGTSWLPMLFAVFLNEIRCVKFRKFIQTVTTLPNFVSWVLVYSIAFSLFNSTGMANTLLMNLGITKEPILFLQSTKHVWFTQWLWLTWKNLGWAAIMYIAAISGIDDELFQAAKVDGASRMQLIRHITIPSLIPTYFVLLMINIANFLNNGMEQYYVFQNAFNKEYIQVLDLYVYNTAMGSGSYSVSVAISMLKSLVSVVLLVGANAFSKKVRGESFI
jgi:putative aldouronate transport system permease protein